MNVARSKWQLKANFVSSKPQSLANFTSVKWASFLKLQPPKITSPSKVEASKMAVISNDVPQNLVESGNFTSFNQANSWKIALLNSASCLNFAPENVHRPSKVVALHVMLLMMVSEKSTSSVKMVRCKSILQSLHRPWVAL